MFYKGVSLLPRLIIMIYHCHVFHKHVKIGFDSILLFSQATSCPKESWSSFSEIFSMFSSIDNRTFVFRLREFSLSFDYSSIMFSLHA